MLPNTIYTGKFNAGHIQGIAIDEERGFLFCSFTTVLTKHTLDGQLIGSVTGLAGHLGCITYDKKNDRVIGSLELKHDKIGLGILSMTGKKISEEDAFYMVEFDSKKIDKPNLDAEKDGIMRSVYLFDVCRDYSSLDEASGSAHRYGCSGIDGVAIGPSPKNTSEEKILVAYGIFSETERQDNDYQVLLEYSPSVFEKYGKPLLQSEPHHSGPKSFDNRYFVYTGNTNYGIQNLEYDDYTNCYIAAVYPGKKESFTPFNLFFINSGSCTEKVLKGRAGERGLTLSLNAFLGEIGKEDIRGSHFPLGATGIYSLGGGNYYFSENHSDPETKEQYSYIKKFKFDNSSSDLFIECN